MNTRLSVTRTLGILAVGALCAAPSFAQKITSAGVTDITFNGLPNSVDVHLKDMSNGSSLANVNVQSLTSSLKLPINSTVKCAKSQWDYSHSLVGFGAFNPTFLDALVVHQAPNPNAGHTTWTGSKWITEAAATHQYQVPLNALKNPAKSDHQLDVLAEFNAAMNTFIQQGGTKLDFLKSNRTIDVQRQVSVLGACWTGVSSKGFATYTRPLTIRIKYQGNPKLTAINAQLGQMGGGGIQAGPQPMNITSGQILPYAPNYRGACPADLKFRVQLNGVGKGEARYQISQNGSTVFTSPALPFADGKLQHDFNVLMPYLGKQSLNNKVPHTYRLHVRFKDEKTAVWPAHYQLLGSKDWSHTCVPQLNGALGGQGGQGIDQLAPNGDSPTPGMKVQAQPKPADPGPNFTPSRIAPQPAQPRNVQPAN
jgi:hypothetical protein